MQTLDAIFIALSATSSPENSVFSSNAIAAAK